MGVVASNRAMALDALHHVVLFGATRALWLLPRCFMARMSQGTDHIARFTLTVGDSVLEPFSAALNHHLVHLFSVVS